MTKFVMHVAPLVFLGGCAPSGILPGDCIVVTDLFQKGKPAIMATYVNTSDATHWYVYNGEVYGRAWGDIRIVSCEWVSENI